ncbi:MAG: hypothetical protein LKM30_01290 [Bacilli bacterium]|jgi:uncharacterized membrane protein|nr:hypothetical protein [Bacilli bacterium]
MEEKKTKPVRKHYVSEIIWYVSLAACWITGFVFCVLGMIAYNVGRITDNPLYQAEKGFAKAFGQKDGTVWDFRIFGTLVMAVVMILALIVIFYFTDKETKAIAAEKRKQERMRILMAGGTQEEANKAADALDQKKA